MVIRILCVEKGYVMKTEMVIHGHDTKVHI